MRYYSKLLYVVLIFIAFVGGVYFFVGVTSFLFAWVLNLMLMMVTLAFTQTFQPPLTSPYYKCKKWEMQGRIYRYIGIDVFRKCLVWVGWEKYNKHTVPVKNQADALRHLEYMSRQSEFGHLIIFWIVLAIALYVWSEHGFLPSLSLLSLNIILNGYPVALQRYNRPRYQKALQQKLEQSQGELEIKV
jgi:hypothetical protein